MHSIIEQKFEIWSVIKLKTEQIYEIFTDASFDSATKIGTYAIVITKQKKIVKAFAKKCRIKLDNSTECEIFAVFQALNIIEGSLIKERQVQKFFLRTDCMIAKKFLIGQNTKTKIFKQNAELCNTMRETYKRISLKMNRKDCSFKVQWIPRGNNKVAHKYSYLAFQKHISQEYKNNIKLLNKKELLKFIKKFNSNQFKILMYLYLIANDKKIILKKQKEVAESLGLSISCVNKKFKELATNNWLEKIGNGKYILK